MIFFHLKNCLLLYISMPQSAAFSPQRASFLFHALRSDFSTEQRRSFCFFFEAIVGIFHNFYRLPFLCVHPVVSRQLRTEFPLYSVQNIRFFVLPFFISAVPLMRGAEGNAAVPCRVCTRQGTAIYSSVSGSGCSKLLSMSACSSCRAWSSSEYGTKKSVRVPTSPV